MQEAALKGRSNAISINSKYTDAKSLKASTLNNLEKPKEALEIWKGKKKFNPNLSVEYLQIEAISYMMLRVWETAKNLLILHSRDFQKAKLRGYI